MSRRYALALVEIEPDLGMAEALARLGRWVAVLGLLVWRLVVIALRLGWRGARGTARKVGEWVDAEPVLIAVFLSWVTMITVALVASGALR